MGGRRRRDACRGGLRNGGCRSGGRLDVRAEDLDGVDEHLAAEKQPREEKPNSEVLGAEVAHVDDGVLVDPRGQLVMGDPHPATTPVDLRIQGGTEERGRAPDVEAEGQTLEKAGVGRPNRADRAEQGRESTHPHASARTVTRRHHPHIALLLVPVITDLAPRSRPGKRAVGAMPADRGELVLVVLGLVGRGGDSQAHEGDAGEGCGESPHADMARIKWATVVSSDVFGASPASTSRGRETMK